MIQPPFDHAGIPPGAVEISIAFFLMLAIIIVGLPLARAFARRLDRAPVRPGIAPEVVEQLQRIEHGMEAMSIEVERISESQRYLAKRLDTPAIPQETRR